MPRAAKASRTFVATIVTLAMLDQYHWQYDLRVVLVHDGLYGRNHLYSYIKHKGQWWKTVDYNVTKARSVRSLYVIYSPN